MLVSSIDLGINFLVLSYFRAVTLDKSPYLSEPRRRRPPVDDGSDNTYVTRLLCCLNGIK